jgi:hypothetical protein
MEQQKFEQCKTWFKQYVAGFYGRDSYIDANIELKDSHSRRVCDEMNYLTGQLGLNPNQKRIAEFIALLHDVGRFPQFFKYKTYNDPRSENHCLLGLQVIRDENLFCDIDESEKLIIEKAIELHGVKLLPPDLSGDCLLFSKLIRDADKLDIYYVVISYYKQHLQNPDKFKIEIELPNEPYYSPSIIDNILNYYQTDYRTLKTWNDMKLIQLSWVYDVNFIPTLKRIKQRRFMETILEFLPQTDDIKKVKEKIFEYVDSRIAQDSQFGCQS